MASPSTPLSSSIASHHRSSPPSSPIIQSIHPSLITDPQTPKTHLSDLKGDVLLAWVCCRGSWLSLAGVHLPWVVAFACLPSVVAFDCQSLLPWVEMEFATM
nr:hypothetical protein CFP56_43470 [Quercus suber]